MKINLQDRDWTQSDASSMMAPEQKFMYEIFIVFIYRQGTSLKDYDLPKVIYLILAYLRPSSGDVNSPSAYISSKLCNFIVVINFLKLCLNLKRITSNSKHF